MSEKTTGKVEWYNSSRGFGVIIGSDGEEYFVHTSKLSPDIKELKIGTRLIFEVSPRPHYKGGHESNQVNWTGGYEAIHVELDNSPVPESPPVIKQTRPMPHIAPTPPIDSGTDYWYQSYSAGTNTHNQLGHKKESLETKVVGVTYEGRQSIVALLRTGEEVLLVREPDNPYDGNAIKVIRKHGQCFGFISRHLAASLASKFDKYGKPVEATVISLTRGYSSDSNLGVTIQFSIPEPANDDSDFDF
jgi:cold shock CspA family protein